MAPVSPGHCFVAAHSTTRDTTHGHRRPQARDRLRAAAARQGCDIPVIPLTALATAILLLGTPAILCGAFLHRLADRGHARDTGLIWRAAVTDIPYLSGSVGPLIGWLECETSDHQINALAECFGELTTFDLLAAANSPTVGGDLLGPTYSLLRGTRSQQRAGAFFTPPGLSALLADVTGPGPGDRVYEPACGTGGMVLAAVRSMRSRGLDPNSCTWTLNDRDPLAVALAAVNMSARGVRTVQIHCADAFAEPAAGDSSEAWGMPHTNPA